MAGVPRSGRTTGDLKAEILITVAHEPALTGADIYREMATESRARIYRLLRILVRDQLLYFTLPNDVEHNYHLGKLGASFLELRKDSLIHEAERCANAIYQYGLNLNEASQP